MHLQQKSHTKNILQSRPAPTQNMKNSTKASQADKNLIQEAEEYMNEVIRKLTAQELESRREPKHKGKPKHPRTEEKDQKSPSQQS